MARIVFFRGSESSSHIITAGQNSVSVLQSREYSPVSLEHGCAFYVPTIIDINSALSYDGVDLAIRIYMDCIQSGIYDVAIFLTSAEEKGSFYSHCDRADILKCPNVFFIKNSKSAIEASICSLNILSFEKDTALASLKMLKLKAPSAYKSHHSISNEWSIYKWSKFLELESPRISSEIEGSLYFKHLALTKNLNSLSTTPFIPSIITDVNSPTPKILLVDDEAEKGWNDFFERILSKSSVHFEFVGASSFRHKSSEEIESIVISKVKSFDPDVVILDLRLEDADFNSERRSDAYTGIRILKRIKQEINQGIQVIGFTASNKVWNYLEWNDSGHGIDDIVVKESPELSENPSYTVDTVTHLFSAIMVGVKRAQYLKAIDVRLKQIGHLIKKTNASFYLGEQHNISVAYELIKEYENPKYIAYAFLQMFQILEKYLKLLAEWDNDKFKLKHSGKEYILLKHVSSATDGKKICESAISGKGGSFTLNKGEYICSFVESNYIMCAALIFLFGRKSTFVKKNNPDKWMGKWIEVRNVRNKKAVHPESYDVNEDEFIALLDYIQFFFDPNNLKLRNESEALVELPPPTPSGATLSDDPAIANLLLSMKK